MNKHVKAVLGTLAVILVLASTIILSIWRVNPPRADESSSAFQQMMYNLERMATGVRWVGTPEAAVARDKIIAEIEAMGLNPQVHRSTWSIEGQGAARLRIFEMRTDWEVSYDEGRTEWTREWIRERFPEHPLVTQEYMYVDNIWITLESPDPTAGNIMFVAHFDTHPVLRTI